MVWNRKRQWNRKYWSRNTRNWSWRDRRGTRKKRTAKAIYSWNKQHPGEKKMFDILNSEQDAKKNRNWNKPWQNSWLVFCHWQDSIKFFKRNLKGAKCLLTNPDRRIWCWHYKIYTRNIWTCLSKNAWKSWHERAACTYFVHGKFRIPNVIDQ